MRVLAVQCDPVVGDVERNERICREGIAAAAAGGARIALFPELALSGYPPRDLLLRRGLVRACREAAGRVALATAGTDVIAVYGAPWEDAGLRNSAVVAFGGSIVAVRHKSLLPTYDVFDEARYFRPETDPQPTRVGGLSLGVTICEDLWSDGDVGRPSYAFDPVERMRGCDVLLNLSASPFHAGRQDARLARARRAARVAPVVYCNQVGGNDELLFDGGSLAVDGHGRLVAVAPQFRTADLRVETAGDPVTHAPLGFEEEVLHALTMGVRDYALRTGFRTAILGLSGGVDSALVAVVAARALGPENVRTVAMPGPFSSPGSLTDAADLATRLGVRHEVVPITPSYASLLESLAPALRGAPRDVTEENLQARVRGTVLMALSNKFGHLLLTTGNKSEMGVGYCTLYGDMNGGLAVIADVYKTDVYRLVRFLNRGGELVPESILQKPPSAELAPNQKDQDSLPPYDELDAILRMYLEEGAEAEDIVAAGHDPAVVARVLRLSVRSEYKRWQAAPTLRVSPRAFGVGRRIPIATRWI